MSPCLRLPLLLLLLLQAAVSEGAAKAPWVEVKSPHFVAYTDAGEATARELLQRFEGLRELLRSAFPQTQAAPPRPLVLVIHRDQDSMKGFIPTLFEKGDFFRLGGAFLTSASHRFALIPTDSGASVQRYQTVIFHWYIHSLIQQSFPELPPWLEEGIASFYGVTEFKPNKVLVGQADTGFRIRLKSHPTTWIPMETLLTLPWDTLQDWSYDQATGFQVLSWTLVHYLWVDPEARKAGLFDAYMKALRAPGKEARTSAKASLGDLLKLQNTLGLYLRKPMLSYWTLPLLARLEDKDLQVRSLDEAKVLVLRDECRQASAEWKDPCPLPKPWK